MAGCFMCNLPLSRKRGALNRRRYYNMSLRFGFGGPYDFIVHIDVHIPVQTCHCFRQKTGFF